MSKRVPNFPAPKCRFPVGIRICSGVLQAHQVHKLVKKRQRRSYWATGPKTGSFRAHARESGWLCIWKKPKDHRHPSAVLVRKYGIPRENPNSPFSHTTVISQSVGRCFELRKRRYAVSKAGTCKGPFINYVTCDRAAGDG